jgi:hypothetical protein
MIPTVSYDLRTQKVERNDNVKTEINSKRIGTYGDRCYLSLRHLYGTRRGTDGTHALVRVE